MIKVLHNPKSEEYLSFKEFILSNKMKWVYIPHTTESEMDGHTNIGMYAHGLLVAPEKTKLQVPEVVDTAMFNAASVICYNTLLENDIIVNSFLRMSINCVHPLSKVVKSVPHRDHEDIKEHNNLLIYLTNSGGKTVVGDEYHDPQEDDVITFGGYEHYHYTPEKERRIVIVATFI
jgi:hypothetical protein